MNAAIFFLQWVLSINVGGNTIFCVKDILDAKDRLKRANAWLLDFREKFLLAVERRGDRSPLEQWQEVWEDAMLFGVIQHPTIKTEKAKTNLLRAVTARRSSALILGYEEWADSDVLIEENVWMYIGSCFFQDILHMSHFPLVNRLMEVIKDVAGHREEALDISLTLLASMLIYEHDINYVEQPGGPSWEAYSINGMMRFLDKRVAIYKMLLLHSVSDGYDDCMEGGEPISTAKNLLFIINREAKNHISRLNLFLGDEVLFD